MFTLTLQSVETSVRSKISVYLAHGLPGAVLYYIVILNNSNISLKMYFRISSFMINTLINNFLYSALQNIVSECS